MFDLIADSSFCNLKSHEINIIQLGISEGWPVQWQCLKCQLVHGRRKRNNVSQRGNMAVAYIPRKYAATVEPERQDLGPISNLWWNKHCCRSWVYRGSWTTTIFSSDSSRTPKEISRCRCLCAWEMDGWYSIQWGQAKRILSLQSWPPWLFR